MMAERPIDCSYCNREISLCYKEITSDGVVETHMCKECPFLKLKLKGDASAVESLKENEDITNLFCGQCHTQLDSLLSSNPLGCPECYEVFGETISKELEKQGKIAFPIKKKGSTVSVSLHIGKTPERSSKLSASSQLMALSEALNEALNKENYEEAAWLRDQIQQLIKKNEQSE